MSVIDGSYHHGLRRYLLGGLQPRHLRQRRGSGDVHDDPALSHHAQQLHVQRAIHGENSVRFPQIWRNREGAAAVEFALTAPAFFAMLVGIIEFGLLLWTQIGLQHGAEMAARCATVDSTLCPNSNPGAITSYAAQQAFGLALPSQTFTYSTPACGNQVSASHAFQFPAILNL